MELSGSAYQEGKPALCCGKSGIGGVAVSKASAIIQPVKVTVNELAVSGYNKGKHLDVRMACNARIVRVSAVFGP